MIATREPASFLNAEVERRGLDALFHRDPIQLLTRDLQGHCDEDDLWNSDLYFADAKR